MSDPSKRSQFDSYGHTQETFSQEPSFGASIFEKIFGSAFQQSSQQHVEQDLVLQMEDAMRGCKIQRTFRIPEDCRRCNGTGRKPGVKEHRCVHCNGTGEMRSVQHGFYFTRTCGYCGGQGTFIPKDGLCGSCDDGTVMGERSLSIDVPAGADEGMKLIYRGNGYKGGDLYLRIRIIPSRIFTRKDNDVFVQCKIPLVVALCGGEAAIPTLEGQESIDVQPGTQPGDQRALRGRGCPSVRGGRRGDLVITFKVEVPKLDSSTRQKLREILNK